MKRNIMTGGGRKSLLVAVAAIAGSIAVCGTQRTLTGVESVLYPGDDTNGGFWDVSERPSSTVDDGTATLNAAIDTSGGTRAGYTADGTVDTHYPYQDESGCIPIRTDAPRGLWLILK